MTHRRLRCRFPALLFALAAAEPCWSTQYTIEDLGLGSANGINNKGQVVGTLTVSTLRRPVVWDGSQPTALEVPQDRPATPVAINESGAVAGSWSPSEGEGLSRLVRPIFWINSTPIDLPFYGWGVDINDSGQGIGSCIRDPGPLEQKIFTFDGQTLQDIGLGAASAVNNLGQVTGFDHVTRRPAVWSTGSIEYLTDLGGGLADVADINDLGQVVGYSQTAEGVEHACLWNSPTALDLGSLGATASRAHAINNLGQIVGYIWDEGNYRAFVYGDGQMHNLNDLIPANSGWSLYEAYDINDHGQIVGYGYLDGNMHAFLLTPTPEPASLALFSYVVAMLPRRRSGRLPVA
jgi:probable HAF family extracellular repeat protein